MTRFFIITLSLVASVSLVLSSPPAQAGSKGRKNTAYVLGGLAAWKLLQGDITEGLILGAGAGYAWKRAEDARKAEEKRFRRYPHYGYENPKNRRSSSRPNFGQDRRDNSIEVVGSITAVDYNSRHFQVEDQRGKIWLVHFESSRVEDLQEGDPVRITGVYSGNQILARRVQIIAE